MTVTSIDQQSTRFIEAVSAMHAADGVRSTAEAAVAAAMALVPGTSAAGVALSRGREAMEIEAASSDAVRSCDRRQHELRDGPLYALKEGEMVSWGLIGSNSWRRWGVHAAEKTDARSVLCIRLRSRESAVGALYLYGRERDSFDVETRQLAMLVAQHAAAALDNAREIHTLRRAVLSRTTTATAVGILMARYKVDDERAFELLRRWSSHRNEKLRMVAAEVVRRQVDSPSGGPTAELVRDATEAIAPEPAAHSTRAQRPDRAGRTRTAKVLKAG